MRACACARVAVLAYRCTESTSRIDNVVHAVRPVIVSYDTLYLNHSVHYNTIVAISNILNLNVDFVSPSCTLLAREWR